MYKKATMYNNNRVNLIIIQHLAMTMRDILRYGCLIVLSDAGLSADKLKKIHRWSDIFLPLVVPLVTWPDKSGFCTIDIGNSPNIGKTVSGRSCKMSQAPSPTINYRHQANVHLKLWTLQKNSEICHKHIHKQRKPILESPGNRK